MAACYRAPVKIAVVIPALDESERIALTIRSAKASQSDEGAESEPGFELEHEVEVEVWVVDGGSGDETVARANAAGARVIQAEAGRARQLQAGVEASASDVLLFLHADTRLPAGWPSAVRAVLADPGVCGGCFRLRFDAEGGGALGLRLLEWGVRLRVLLFGLPYGDQALFVRRGVLEMIGGVPQVPLMEDVDLVSAMKTQGRLACLRLPVMTSPRRYRDAGLWRTAWRHQLALLARGLGVDRARIAGWMGR